MKKLFNDNPLLFKLILIGFGVYLISCGNMGNINSDIDTKANNPDNPEAEQVNINPDEQPKPRKQVVNKPVVKVIKKPTLLKLPERPDLGQAPREPDYKAIFVAKLKFIDSYVKNWKAPKIGDKARFITPDGNMHSGIIDSFTGDSITLNKKDIKTTFAANEMRDYYKQKYIQNEYIKQQINIDIEKLKVKYKQIVIKHNKPLEAWKNKYAFVEAKNNVLMSKYDALILTEKKKNQEIEKVKQLAKHLAFIPSLYKLNQTQLKKLGIESRGTWQGEYHGIIKKNYKGWLQVGFSYQANGYLGIISFIPKELIKNEKEAIKIVKEKFGIDIKDSKRHWSPGGYLYGDTTPKTANAINDKIKLVNLIINDWRSNDRRIKTIIVSFNVSWKE